MKNLNQPNSVQLWSVLHAGIIVSHPTGVWYDNQVGGHACRQESLEGFYVPLPDAHFGKLPVPDMLAPIARKDKNGYPWLDLQEALEHIILGKYGGECYRGIDSETADKIDVVLNLVPDLQSGLSVDRTKLDKCQEAWIFVIGKNINAIDGFGGEFEGVLTWFNSD